MSFFNPPSATQCSVIRSRARSGVPETFSSVRSVKDLVDQDYCDPHDPCCVNRDPEVFLHDSVLRQSARKICAPKNPLHFEYNILHRFKLKRMLRMASERQQNDELTPEQLEEIKRMEDEDDASQKLQAQVTPSRVVNMAVSIKPETSLPPPPKPVVGDPMDLQKHLQGLANMALAHEIALNKDIKMRKANEASAGDDQFSLQLQLAQVAKDRYWVKVDQILVKKDLKNHKHVVIDVLSTLKSGLQSTILPHNWNMREKIEQELDMKKITKQIEGDAFDFMVQIANIIKSTMPPYYFISVLNDLFCASLFQYYVDFVLDTLAALCCPVRDKDIVEIRDNPVLSRQIRKILDLMENINLDMANFVLSQSRAHTMQNCILYERNKFANYVETQYRAGYDPLSVTRDWIRRHSIPDRPFSEAMAYAFLEVLEWEDDKEWPETLALDWHRFPLIREEIVRVTVIGTIVTCVYEYALTLLRDSPEDANDFEKNQLCLLKNLRLLSKLREGIHDLLTCEDLRDPGKFREALVACGEQAGKVVDEHKQTELCRGISEGDKIKIQQIVLPLTNLDHSVRKAYHDQVRTWFWELAKEDGKAQIRTPDNLRSVGPLIIVPITEMVRLTMYNRGVFDILYRDIFDGNCGPPTNFPPIPEEKNPNKPIVLDANKYGHEDEEDVVMDENISAILGRLRGFKGRSMVYRRSRIDPRTKPMFEDDGTPLIPPERRPEYVPKQMTAIEQKHYDEYIVAHEPTLDEDYEGVYNFSVEPDFMFGFTTEQLLQIMERENLINANKLRRVKDRLNQEVLHSRVADNLPVFYKLWGKDFGALQKEFCRLQRILEKGPFPMPPGATDEASGKRHFPISCQPPAPPPPELPKVNEKGEKLIYASKGRKKFGVDEQSEKSTKEPEFDFVGVAKALADVKEVDPESFLTHPNAYKDEGDPETSLQKLLRNIPKPDPHWRMLDFRIRIPKSKSNKFQWSRMMKSMARIHGDSPHSPIALFGRPTQRTTPSFNTTWTPSQSYKSYTGAREGGYGGQGAPTSNQTVVHMEIPMMIGKTAILTKADAPQMPGTSDIPPAFASSGNATKFRKPGQNQKSSVGQPMVRFPTVAAPKRQMTTFSVMQNHSQSISARQKLMMKQYQQRCRDRGEMQFGPPPTHLKRSYSFDWRQNRK